jgi:hypothetical protein
MCLTYQLLSVVEWEGAGECTAVDTSIYTLVTLFPTLGAKSVLATENLRSLSLSPLLTSVRLTVESEVTLL